MTANAQIKVWFDGAHAASVEEVELLKARDRDGRYLQFIDVSRAGFAPEGEVTADFVRNSVVARDASGKVSKGVAALEAAYGAIGLCNYFQYTRKPGLESGRRFGPAAPDTTTPELKQAA